MKLIGRCAARALVWSLLLAACQDLDQASPVEPDVHSSLQALQPETPLAVSKRGVSYGYAALESPPAGVAGDEQLVFVGAPLEGRVLVLSRHTGRQLSELPPPEGGFILPFMLHSLGAGKLGVLDAGGLPSPSPFVPVNPTLYEYSYTFEPRTGFRAQLTRSVSFADVTIGFAEDFAVIGRGRYVLSDAVLGALWVVETDGSIRPGIVPESFEPEHAIPELAVCPSMPLIDVGGIPFLFSGSTLPGVSPLATRNGLLYFYSPCAEGLFSVPLASLFDARPPHERAEDIRLVSAKPAHVPVEQLLGLTFNPYDPRDGYLYAADSLQLRLIRIDPRNGRRQVVTDEPRLFNFPSSMSFLPPVFGLSPLVTVSNQQHRNPLTNEAISDDRTLLPFFIAKTYVRH